MSHGVISYRRNLIGSNSKPLLNKLTHSLKGELRQIARKVKQQLLSQPVDSLKQFIDSVATTLLSNSQQNQDQIIDSFTKWAKTYSRELKQPLYLIELRKYLNTVLDCPDNTQSFKETLCKFVIYNLPITDDFILNLFDKENEGNNKFFFETLGKNFFKENTYLDFEKLLDILGEKIYDLKSADEILTIILKINGKEQTKFQEILINQIKNIKKEINKDINKSDELLQEYIIDQKLLLGLIAKETHQEKLKILIKVFIESFQLKFSRDQKEIESTLDFDLLKDSIPDISNKILETNDQKLGEEFDNQLHKLIYSFLPYSNQTAINNLLITLISEKEFYKEDPKFYLDILEYASKKKIIISKDLGKLLFEKLDDSSDTVDFLVNQLAATKDFGQTKQIAESNIVTLLKTHKGQDHRKHKYPKLLHNFLLRVNLKDLQEFIVDQKGTSGLDILGRYLKIPAFEKKLIEHYAKNPIPKIDELPEGNLKNWFMTLLHRRFT